MLIQRDHEKLVEELNKLRDRYGYEVNVVSMDKLSPFEQLQPAGRTTVCTFYLPIRSGLTVDLIITDYDGGARQWSDVAVVDEALATLDSYRILLCWRFCTRLRIHYAGSGYGALWVLGRQVCLNLMWRFRLAFMRHTATLLVLKFHV